jgi:protein-serine/threonine kinase
MKRWLFSFNFPVIFPRKNVTSLYSQMDSQPSQPERKLSKKKSIFNLFKRKSSANLNTQGAVSSPSLSNHQTIPLSSTIHSSSSSQTVLNSVSSSIEDQTVDSKILSPPPAKTLRRVASRSSVKFVDLLVRPSNFEKIKLIGKGDVGKVYLVKQKVDGKLFAMKVLNKREMLERNKVKRVLAEQEILAASNHPFIVTL